MDGVTLRSRAVVFALSAGAVAFFLALLVTTRAGLESGDLGRAFIPAIVCAAFCWASAERSIAGTAAAIDAAIGRLGDAADGDLSSDIPPDVAVAVPPLARAMSRLFAQLAANLDDIRRMALFDTVTGLPNRLHFRSQCDVLLAAPSGMRSALLFIDLDRFKHVNDTHGHAVGDLSLATVADRLRDAAASATPHAVVGRLAGDEFTMFLPAGSADGVRGFADALLASLCQPFATPEGDVTIGASIGIALRDNGESLSELMKAADGAMYPAKRAGRGRIEIAGAPAEASLPSRLIPIGAAQDARPDAMLLNTGAIMPGEPYIASLAASLAVGGAGPRLAVPVTATWLAQLDFAGLMIAACADAGVVPAMLEIVIDEGAAMTCSDRALAGLGALRAQGAGVTIRGFGTGATDLARWRMLPVDRVMIPPASIGAIVDDAAARGILAAVIRIVHELGARVTAEGVTTAAQAGILRVIGCDAMAGPLVGQPIEVAAFLAGRRGKDAEALTISA